MVGPHMPPGFQDRGRHPTQMTHRGKGQRAERPRNGGLWHEADTARAFHDFMVGIWVWVSVFVGDANLEAFQKWLWGTPQEQQQALQQHPALSEKVEALFVVFQRHMDTRYEVYTLSRDVLTLPGLPEEGY
jgi:hypothetical protein